ncbi:MAG: LysR family transcriptional regulator [Burkholderiaceae bacterium]|nr:LysR family transcriptional regulator [Burkholderiaceae bacterium]
MDRLQSMRVFAKVAELRSFSGAARALDLSPAVVTRLVADLEEHLGARLLNRTTRRLALTQTGELYLVRVQDVLERIEEAEQVAGDATTTPSGRLHIAASSSFVVNQLAKHLPRFRERYPQVTLDISAIRNPDAPDDDHDLTILLEGFRPLSGDFVARLLAQSEVVLCAAPSYLKRRGTPLVAEDLGEHDGLVVDLPDVPKQWKLRRNCASHAIGAAHLDDGDMQEVPMMQAVLTSSHPDTLMASAVGGLGIVALPSFIIEDAVRSGKLVRVLHEWSLVTYSVYAALPSRRYLPQRTRAFLDFLVETFGGLAQDPWLIAAGCPTAMAKAQAMVTAEQVS